ncbi:hypothetical protein PhCBS80983_g00177 [Powellomyces hirtus]|uniref:Uncharacterized protein n=1 Tax=Powellomyces hirtus TaxID=109895 RepID=A0A507EFT4_9FUNG|nr:hypothetical protein PhCBS80983_g00177 [Powellomyces hirtus]
MYGGNNGDRYRYEDQQQQQPTSPGPQQRDHYYERRSDDRNDDRYPADRNNDRYYDEPASYQEPGSIVDRYAIPSSSESQAPVAEHHQNSPTSAAIPTFAEYEYPAEPEYRSPTQPDYAYPAEPEYAYPPQPAYGYAAQPHSRYPAPPPTEYSYATPHHSDRGYPAPAASDYGYAASSKPAYPYPQASQSEYSYGGTTVYGGAPSASSYSKPMTPVVVPVASVPAMKAANTHHNRPHQPTRYNKADHHDDDKKVGSARYCCGCFATRRNCFLTYGLILFLLLAGAGVSIWYFWPKVPGVITSDPYIPASAAGFKIASGTTWRPGIFATDNMLTASKEDPFVLSLGLAVNVTVTSENNVGFRVNSLVITGQLVEKQGEKNFKPIKPVGDDKLDVVSKVENIRINKRANTTILFPISVNYTLTHSLRQLAARNDPIISALIVACGLPGVLPKAPGAKLWMAVKVAVDLKILAWTGMNPPEIDQEPRSFDCPVSVTSQLAALPGISDAFAPGGSAAAPGAANAGAAIGDAIANPQGAVDAVAGAIGA